MNCNPAEVTGKTDGFIVPTNMEAVAEQLALKYPEAFNTSDRVVVCTSSLTKDGKHVLHSAVPDISNVPTNEAQRRLRHSLRQDLLHFLNPDKIVVMPALGTRECSGCLPYGDAAECLLEVLQTFSHSGKRLPELTIAVSNADGYKQFHTACSQWPAKK